jgi:hypothetical protein
MLSWAWSSGQLRVCGGNSGLARITTVPINFKRKIICLKKLYLCQLCFGTDITALHQLVQSARFVLQNSSQIIKTIVMDRVDLRHMEEAASWASVTAWHCRRKTPKAEFSGGCRYTGPETKQTETHLNSAKYSSDDSVFRIYLSHGETRSHFLRNR